MLVLGSREKSLEGHMATIKTIYEKYIGAM